MNIKDLSTDTLQAITSRLSTTTPETPLTRQEIAQTANVERQTVGELLAELRLQGWLILEDERGCWLASSFAEVKEWRTTTLIPAMLVLLRTDQAIHQAAL